VLYTHAGAKGIFRSADLGTTWNKVSDAAIETLLVADPSNLKISVGIANNVYVAIVLEGTLAGLFRSGNGGATWTALDLPKTTEAGGARFGIHPGRQGSIHLSLAADHRDANLVYVGGDRQPRFNEGAPGAFFPNSLGANDYTGRLFRVDASRESGRQAAPLTHSGTQSNSAPHADSRDMAMAANGMLIETDDGGIYRRTSPHNSAGNCFQ
jgi:hypothetical protein